MAGAVVGTVEYMAPEQARAQPVDQRADIYAFGLILYDMLLGRQRAERRQTARSPSCKARMEQPLRPRRGRSTRPSPRRSTSSSRAASNRIATKRYQTTPELVADARSARRRRRADPGQPRRLTPMVNGGGRALVSRCCSAARGGTRAAGHPVAARSGVGRDRRLPERDRRRRRSIARSSR